MIVKNGRVVDMTTGMPERAGRLLFEVMKILDPGPAQNWNDLSKCGRNFHENTAESFLFRNLADSTT